MSNVWIGSALDQLRANVAAGNQRGNVEGLLARHLLEEDPRLGLQWTVDCDMAWMQSTYDPSNLGSVAALAYTLTHTGSGTLQSELESGLQRASARDPKTAGRGAALHDPAVLVGLCLGANVLEGHSQYSTWCASVVRSLLATSNTRRIDCMWAYGAELCKSDAAGLRMDLNAPLVHRAALDWWFRKPHHRAFSDIATLARLRQSVVEEVLSEPLPQVPAHQAALLWLCLRDAVSEATTAALHTPATIAHALRQFQTSLKRWRWDPDRLQHPIRWMIRCEREVQDILWMMLRPICPDLEDEDTLPKFGHSSYRADFGIPSLGLLVEAKFARDAADFKSIEKEVLEDLVPYLKTPNRYREVLVCIYDDSCSVQNHDTTIRALKGVAGISDVIVVCRPSQLPSASEQGRS